MVRKATRMTKFSAYLATLRHTPVEDHMTAAIASIAKARKIVPTSVNYTSTSSPIRHADGKGVYQDTSTALADLRDQLRTIKQEFLDSWFGSERDRTRRMVGKMFEQIRRARVGNCHEQAMLVAHLLRQTTIRTFASTAVEIVTVENAGDTHHDINSAVIPHWFVVIGRTGGRGTRDADIGLPSSWGTSAVVADAWDRVAYPARFYDGYWAGLKTANADQTLKCVLRYRL